MMLAFTGKQKPKRNKPMRHHSSLLTLFALAVSGISFAATIGLEELNIADMSSGWGSPKKNGSVTDKPMGIGGKKYERGVGTHAESSLWLSLDGKVASFSAEVGVDDHAGSDAASVEFIVLSGDRELWRSGVCKMGGKAKKCDVSLSGLKEVELVVTDGEDGVNFDHANWANARFEYSGAPPVSAAADTPKEDAVLLTPPAPAEPRVNGPKVYGVRPGSPFLYRIPATGDRPMTFSAQGLPEGLSLDAETGVITGSVPAAGTHKTVLTAKNSLGESSRDFRIVVGDTLALTPPMGWNSWYIHYNRVTDAVMRQAADQMIGTGMADYGYQYVNIDDCWMVKDGSDDPILGGPQRDENGRLLGNKNFPDMAGLAAYIHAKGLKAGLYISPGPRTCAGYAGSFGYEELDARTFAEWGFDFLKYDWCSYGEKAGKGREELIKPYRIMWDHLQKQNRDIVHNLCQYGMGEVWTWGGDVGNCWRTTGDLGLEKNSRLPGCFGIGMSNARRWEYARPGAWNDPDYILIGWVGDAAGMGEGKPTTLTPNEQYAYMSMWSLMAAPLIFSGDMAKLDPFTLNVLCNHEVIDVDQDPLGKQGRIVRRTRTEFVLAKDLEDGSKAVGLFNFDKTPKKLKVDWTELGLSGKCQIRDLWRQKDTVTADGFFEAEVPRHGVAMVKLSAVR